MTDFLTKKTKKKQVPSDTFWAHERRKKRQQPLVARGGQTAPNVRKLKMEEMSGIVKRFSRPAPNKGNKTQRVRKKNICIFRSPLMQALKIDTNVQSLKKNALMPAWEPKALVVVCPRAEEEKRTLRWKWWCIFRGFHSCFIFSCFALISLSLPFVVLCSVSFGFFGGFFSVAVMAHFPISFCLPFLPVKPYRGSPTFRAPIFRFSPICPFSTKKILCLCSPVFAFFRRWSLTHLPRWIRCCNVKLCSLWSAFFLTATHLGRKN